MLGEPRRLLSARLPPGRVPPSPRRLARRRIFLWLAKLALPAFALVLLSSIALWPEFERTTDQGRFAFRRVAGDINGARLSDARYRGLDDKGRPYTLTAETANQVSDDRVDLVVPKADITMTDGTWLFGQSKQGVYMRQSGQLDLSHQVELYRDDGTVIRTETASIDVKAGAAAGHDPVSAEGPFGTLDSTDGFALTDRGDVIQFDGPSRLFMNGATKSVNEAPK